MGIADKILQSAVVRKNVALVNKSLVVDINQLNELIPSSVRVTDDVEALMVSRGILSTDSKYTSTVTYYSGILTDRKNKEIELSQNKIILHAIEVYVNYTDDNGSTPTAVQLKENMTQGSNEEKDVAVAYLETNIGLSVETT